VIDERVVRIVALGLPSYDRDEIALMTETVFALRPTHIFEWGTNAGVSARIWWEATKGLSPQAEVHSIDHRMPGEFCAEFPELYQGYWVDGTEVHLHQGDGLPFVLDLFETEKPLRALVYLDDSHLLLQNARALKVLHREHPDAVLLIDDVDKGEPLFALNWFLGKHKDDFVVCSTRKMSLLWPVVLGPLEAPS
jgi:hypothetical protein